LLCYGGSNDGYKKQANIFPVRFFVPAQIPQQQQQQPNKAL
jgi:hypothetical protein